VSKFDGVNNQPRKYIKSFTFSPHTYTKENVIGRHSEKADICNPRRHLLETEPQEIQS
jgi:hypothetical protein